MKEGLQILGTKQPVEEPYEWVGVFSTGLIDRKRYEEMEFSSTTPIQMIGSKKDYWFPAYRIAGNSLQDIKLALLKSIDDLFAHVEAVEKSEKEALNKPEEGTENKSN
ncbi:MAG: hypothetical protein M0R32_11360 [Candidatus Cloacimonetes bacterium]|jgi:hypothetical protein|nr:hypothetical protein [Candidatus Cloacimonadota bacterium]